MTRVALYARFSNEDRQNVRSAEDQLTECRRCAASRGWQIVAEFRDEGISGGSLVNRPGAQAMLAAASARLFDVLLVEDEDRIARSLEDLAHVHRRLTFAGARISTLYNDRVELMHVAWKGAQAEQYLVDLGHKTARGMRANAEAGKATGARTYGYSSEPGGAMTIVEAEAEIIREIFARSAAGDAARTIAADFNARGLPAPKGGHWNASTISGNAARGNGILHTDLYVGVKTWGRDLVTKDPDTGKRNHNYRPADEWKRTPVPHLRIVSDEAWTAARARTYAATGVMPQAIAARRQGLLSGLIKCGCCGATYTSAGCSPGGNKLARPKARLVCAAFREKGPTVCANAHRADKVAIERRVLEGLKSRLASPEAAADYVREYRAAWAELEAEGRRRRRPLEQKISELKRREARAAEAYLSGAATIEILAKAKEYEAERLQLEAELAELDASDGSPPPVQLHPQAAAAYARKIEQLQATLATVATDPDARPLIDEVRGLIDRIDVTPDPEAPDGVRIDLVGDLAAFVDQPKAPALGRGSLLVAGACYGQRPPTRRFSVRVAA